MSKDLSPYFKAIGEYVAQDPLSETLQVPADNVSPDDLELLDIPEPIEPTEPVNELPLEDEGHCDGCWL